VDLKVIKRLKPGDAAPAFEVKTLDGKTAKLEDYKGKFVLLSFWASNYGGWGADLTQLKATYEALGNDARFAMLGLNMDKKEEDARAYLEKQGIKWPQAPIGEWEKATLPSDFGINSMPSTWLIGPDGKVIAKDLHGDAIKAAVEKALAEK
jgi:peroxiredoxin